MAEDSPYQVRILCALQRKPVYAGTVPTHIVQVRRAKGRRARASRRANAR